MEYTPPIWNPVLASADVKYPIDGFLQVRGYLTISNFQPVNKFLYPKAKVTKETLINICNVSEYFIYLSFNLSEASGIM